MIGEEDAPRSRWSYDNIFCLKSLAAFLLVCLAFQSHRNFSRWPVEMGIGDCTWSCQCLKTAAPESSQQQTPDDHLDQDGDQSLPLTTSDFPAHRTRHVKPARPPVDLNRFKCGVKTHPQYDDCALVMLQISKSNMSGDIHVDGRRCEEWQVRDCFVRFCALTEDAVDVSSAWLAEEFHSGVLAKCAKWGHRGEQTGSVIRPDGGSSPWQLTVSEYPLRKDDCAECET